MTQSGHGADISAMKQIADQTAARDRSGVTSAGTQTDATRWQIDHVAPQCGASQKVGV
jgi:hypothetical protein